MTETAPTSELRPAEAAAPTRLDLPDDAAARVVSTSILISATRCVLAYVVFPWLLPLVGIAGGVGPALSITIGAVAIGFNVASIRRFHRAGHRWRWAITALNVTVIVLLAVTVVQDVFDLAS